MLKLLIETDKKLAISVNKNVIPNREFMSLKFKDFLNKISSLSIKTVSELKTFTETAYAIEDKKANHSTNNIIDNKI